MASQEIITNSLRLLGGRPVSTTKDTISAAGNVIKDLGVTGAYVRVVCTGTCNVVVTKTSTAATASGMFIPANTPTFISMGPCQFISVFSTPGGDAYVTKMAPASDDYLLGTGVNP